MSRFSIEKQGENSLWIHYRRLKKETNYENSTSGVNGTLNLDTRTASITKIWEEIGLLFLVGYDDTSINDIYFAIGATIVLLIITVTIVLVFKRCRQCYKNDGVKQKCMRLQSKWSSAFSEEPVYFPSRSTFRFSIKRSSKKFLGA